jgi:eukaryotic-like serine/threonine-protein kinase
MNEEWIFAAALEKANVAERAAFLDEACGGDAALRSRIEQKIAAAEETGRAGIDSGSGETSDATSDPAFKGSSVAGSKEGPGSLIGPYKLMHAIGAGGMGFVYLAEQQFPVRRQVALKIIKQGMDTERVIARFEAERQALAMMDHPNIAKVFDANTTDSGRPYFVMELVKGVPITRYCDSNRLTVRERLELFVPVCQAIQHAHQKGIIHRDIKPSNVLVTIYDGKPVPKVIDFGIAKATGQSLTDETMFTQVGAVIGTLEYMSPEQAESSTLDIDTRSDIYSLGALLYELLTGVTPLASAKLREAAYLEMLRKIREDEPLSPSNRLSQSKETLLTTSEQRKTDPDRLPKQLQGELDWIVMRALEKDRTRRYETASGFAQDIERYLNGDPVEAGPPSATYRLRKFASKNKALIGTIAAFAALLILGVVVSTWQAVRARRAQWAATVERDRADSEAATSKAVTDFLQNSLLSQASAQQQGGLDAKPDPDVKVRTLLDRAAAGISGKFASQPLVEAGIRSTIGSTYRDLHLIPQAEEQWKKSYDLSLRYRGADDPETLTALGNLAIIKEDQGNYTESTKLRQQVLDGMTRVLGPQDRRTALAMQGLGVSYLFQGEYPKSEALLKKAYEIQMRTLGPDNIETLDTSDSLITLYRYMGRFPDAEPYAAKGLESYKRVYGPNHPFMLRELFAMAIIYVGEEKFPQAEALLLQVRDGNTKLLGAEHPNTLSTIQTLARAYDGEGRHAEALAMREKVYAAYARVDGADHPDTIVAESDLARSYESAADLRKAIELYKDAIARQTRVLGADHPGTIADMSNLAFLYETRNRYAEALPIEIQMKEIALKKFGPEHKTTVAATTMIGKDYMGLHQYAKAEPPLREALAVMIKTKPDDWRRYNLESLLGANLMGERKYAQAEPLVLSGYQGMKDRESKMPMGAKAFLKEDADRVVELYTAWGRPEKAAEWREKLKSEAPAAAATQPTAAK